jgi:23S rRNA (adenine2503-C2)-methyltransferase
MSIVAVVAVALFLGCTFCATGRMGRLRNLSSDEILAQMFFAKKICRLEDLPEVTNVVYMGMGDASDNVDNVLASTEILTKRELFQLSATRVTVSTVAPTPSAFLQFAKAPCVLAWSVHAANDDLRKRLVPTTKYPMSELRQGLIDALLQRPMNFRTTMLEVALMDGVNDSLEAADEMAAFAQVIVDSVPGCKLIVNLIPYNDIGQQLYKKPKMENVKAFQRHLQSKGIYSKIREARGDDKTAACGQLATSKKPLPTSPVTP